MDYEEPAARIEELEPGEREAAVMLDREFMKFKRKTRAAEATEATYSGG